MPNKVSRTALLNITIIVESVLLLVATGWSMMATIPLLPALHFDIRALLLGLCSGILMALSGFALYRIATRTNTFAGMRDLVDNFLLPMVSELRPFDLVLMATLSGFAEEIFFRGVAQPQIGYILTSIAFGLFHDPSFRHPTYIFTAFFYSLILGLLYIYTGNLWAPIVAHMVHNLISLYLLRYRIKPPTAPAAG